MKKKRKPPGESTFEQYLMSQGLADFEYEKERHGKKRKPDYTIAIDGREYLFEVKDLDYVDMGIEGGFDPYGRIRNKIGEARDQFKEFQGWPCSVVLFNNNAHFIRLNEPHVVLGAMEGDLGVTMLFDTKNGGVVPGSERQAFLGGGKMIQPHWSHAQNTRISALITVWKLRVGQMRLMREYRLFMRSGAADSLFQCVSRNYALSAQDFQLRSTPQKSEARRGISLTFNRKRRDFQSRPNLCTFSA